MGEQSRSERERAFRESIMVDAAERLFIEKGYEAVSMDEVAKVAQFTKRTLYKYFTSKEDLFFAVALKGFKLMARCCSDGFACGKTGFQRLSAGLRAYFSFTRQYPGLFHLMNRVGYMRRNAPSSPKLEEWLTFDDALFKGVSEVVDTGIKDGSIRSDIEPMKGTFSLIFLATGFLRLLNETGEHFADHFNLNVDEFADYSLSLLYESIKPHKPQ